MFQKIKDWFKGIDTRDLVTAILLLCLFGYVIYSSPKTGTNSPETSLVTEDTLMTEDDFVSTYFDVALAVGVTDDYAAKERTREITFSHELYLKYSEDRGTQEHRDFNHPFYVESGDMCEVRVDKKNDKEVVTLMRNITKENLYQTGCYWEDDRPDLD